MPILLGVALASVLATGCTTPVPVSRAFSVRQVIAPEGADVLRLAETAMRELGLTVAARDDLRQTLTTYPFDHQTRLSTGTKPQPPKTYARRRRIVRVRIDRNPGATDVRVFCRVDVQEQTTQALRMLSMDQRSSDVPDQTPIQREAATTARQNTVWQTIHRDRTAERTILDEILGMTER